MLLERFQNRNVEAARQAQCLLSEPDFALIVTQEHLDHSNQNWDVSTVPQVCFHLQKPRNAQPASLMVTTSIKTAGV
jgi:hypothetical protein